MCVRDGVGAECEHLPMCMCVGDGVGVYEWRIVCKYRSMYICVWNSIEVCEWVGICESVRDSTGVCKYVHV